MSRIFSRPVQAITIASSSVMLEQTRHATTRHDSQTCRVEPSGIWAYAVVIAFGSVTPTVVQRYSFSPVVV